MHLKHDSSKKDPVSFCFFGHRDKTSNDLVDLRGHDILFAFHGAAARISLDTRKPWVEGLCPVRRKKKKKKTTNQQRAAFPAANQTPKWERMDSTVVGTVDESWRIV